jgi:hypothetical protein
VVFIHNGILLSHKEDEILSLANKWIELEDIVLREVRLRRPKIACFPSYVDRPKTNIDLKQMQQYYWT